MKTPIVSCTCAKKDSDKSRILYFYISAPGGKYYLFAAPFRRSLFGRFRWGVPLDDALDRSRYEQNQKRIPQRIFRSLWYLDREYGLSILRKSRERRDPRRKRSAPDACDPFDDLDLDVFEAVEEDRSA